MPTVILVLAGGPGFPGGNPEHRYEIEVKLDAAGHLDEAAWRADPAPWPARRLRPDDPLRTGDVQYDLETGWSFRFDPGETGGELTEPVVNASVLRPGEYITIRTADGLEYGYRVVSVV